MQRFIAPPKGSFNPHFGLYVERPFHVVSELPSHRYLDMNGNDIVIKSPNGGQTQVWFFDGKSRTIKNNRFKSKSFDIQNAGRSHNLQAWATNSGWF